MKRVLLSMAVLGGAAQMAGAADYYPTEDVFIRGDAGAATTTRYDPTAPGYNYTQTNNRLAKGFGTSSGNEDGYLSVFDTAAIKTYIEGQIGHTITSQSDLANVTATWNLMRADTTNGDTTGSYTPAVYMGAPITATSDYLFSQNRTAGDGGNVSWTLPNGTAIDDYAGGSGSNGLANVPVRNAAGTVWGAFAPGTYRPFVLDSAVLYSLLTDARSQGLTMVGANDTPHNLYIFGRDANGTGSTAAERVNDPYLSINVVPEPASLSLLAVGGLMALRRRRQA